jgi:hypothetical protein
VAIPSEIRAGSRENPHIPSAPKGFRRSSFVRRETKTMIHAKGACGGLKAEVCIYPDGGSLGGGTAKVV